MTALLVAPNLVYYPLLRFHLLSPCLIVSSNPQAAVPLSMLLLPFHHVGQSLPAVIGTTGEELRVANGAVVGMIAYDQSGVTHCIGMGLIRAVDVPGKKLYMLTPTPRAALPSVRELLIGSLGLPSQLLHSDRYASPYMSLFCLAAEGTGSGSMKSRNNLARRSLLDAAS